MSEYGDKEIGSEFWSVPVVADDAATTGVGQWESARSVGFFQSGRSAMGAVLDAAIACSGIRSIALPAYCCESMIEPAVSRGLEILFYPVTVERGRGVFADFQGLVADAVLLLDYFGLHDASNDFGEGTSAVVIRDVTHSFFSESIRYDADYCFGSLRKWAGFYSGGIAWSNKTPALQQPTVDSSGYVPLRKLAMREKREYMLADGAEKGYLSLFAEAEKLLDDRAVIAGAVDDERRLRRLDISEITQKRLSNYSALYSRLSSYALFPAPTAGAVPLFYPMIIPKDLRSGLRDYLIQHRVYCPIHWPIPDGRAVGLARELYASELSLVCDQRYDEADMRRMADLVIEYLGER